MPLIDIEAGPNQFIFKVYSAERPLLQSREELPHSSRPPHGIALVPERPLSCLSDVSPLQLLEVFSIQRKALNS